MANLLLVLSIFWGDPQKGSGLRPDEINIDVLGGSACRNEKVLFSFHRRGGVAGNLGLFSFLTGRVTILDDGRIKAYAPFLVKTPSGFGVIDRITLNVFFLDEKGNFEDKVSLPSFSAWPEGMALEAVYSDGLERSLATLKQAGKDRYLVGWVNFENRSFNALMNRTCSDSFRHRWLPFGAEFLEVVSETGQIDLVSAGAFQAKRNFYPKQAEVFRDKKRFPHLSKRLPYLTILGTSAFPIEGTLFFQWLETRDSMVPEGLTEIKKSLVLTSESVHFEDQHTLGAWKGEKIVFDWGEWVLKVLPMSGQPR